VGGEAHHGVGASGVAGGVRQWADAFAEAASQPPAPTYTPALLLPCVGSAFFELSSDPILSSQLGSVIETEGPVAEAVLFRRVAQAWGFSRVGARISARLKLRVSGPVGRTSDGGEVFYWPVGLLPETWTRYRVSDLSDQSRRSIQHVCIEELALLALAALRTAKVAPRREIADAVCRMVGMLRSTARAHNRVHDAVSRLVKEGRAIAVDDQVHWSG
jgi:hypothetical protein